MRCTGDKYIYFLRTQMGKFLELEALGALHAKMFLLSLHTTPYTILGTIMTPF